MRIYYYHVERCSFCICSLNIKSINTRLRFILKLIIINP
nr:MAG TPA: hypothetical protein [Caudoviricetes sp.]